MALSEMRTEAGAVDDAATFAARAAEAAVSSGDNVLQGRAWMTMGDAYYESEPAESAASYKRALTAWGDSEDTASMEAIGDFDHRDSEGFLGVLGVGARVLNTSGQV